MKLLCCAFEVPKKQNAFIEYCSAAVSDNDARRENDVYFQQFSFSFILLLHNETESKLLMLFHFVSNAMYSIGALSVKVNTN